MAWLEVCPHCGDRIGVYEPTMVVEPDSVRITSMANEPHLRNSGTIMFHAGYGTTTGIPEPGDNRAETTLHD
jgi:hypothetical protein